MLLHVDVQDWVDGTFGQSADILAHLDVDVSVLGDIIWHWLNFVMHGGKFVGDEFFGGMKEK